MPGHWFRELGAVKPLPLHSWEAIEQAIHEELAIPGPCMRYARVEYCTARLHAALLLRGWGVGSWREGCRVVASLVEPGGLTAKVRSTCLGAALAVAALTLARLMAARDAGEVPTDEPWTTATEDLFDVGTPDVHRR